MKYTKYVIIYILELIVKIFVVERQMFRLGIERYWPDAFHEPRIVLYVFKVTVKI